MARTRLYPPSVDPGFPTLPETPSGWTRTTFGDVLEVVERPTKLQPNEIYRLVNAKRSRGGISLRGELTGREILTKTQFEAKSGDFLISRRQIIHGACGVVPEELDGAIVSNEYSTLRPRPSLLLDFLQHYSHTPYFQRTCFHSSHGVDVEKMIFKINEWLVRPIDLPSLPEQRKIAAILSSVDDAIEASQAVIDQLQVVKKAMMAELLTRGLPGRHTRFKQTEIGEVPESWEVRRLSDLLQSIDAGWSPQCEGRPATLSEWGVLKVSAVTSGVYKEDEQKALPLSLEPRPASEVEPNDVLLARANGVLDLVGRTVLVRSTRPRLMLSDKLLRLRPCTKLLLPSFLNLAMGSDAVRAQILNTTGGSHMRNVSQSSLKGIVLVVPPLSEQAEIAGALDSLEERADAERSTLQSLQDAKAALISVLLTGEVRINLDASDQHPVRTERGEQSDA
ncbi:MAG: restriction endonuclease subunit S [Myxococcales bacterium]|nr:restriction endonuclease subunit S [Myxococcales bacterium]